MPDIIATPQTSALIDESIFRMIEKYQKDRARRQKLYWDYYLGRHYFNVSNERGQPLYGVGKKRVTKNYCKFVVDEGVSALFGKPIDIISLAEGQEEKQKVEETLRGVWTSRTGKRKLLQIGRMGGVSGGCYIEFWFDPEAKVVIPNVLDTEWVTPLYQDKNNIEKLTGVIIDFETCDPAGRPYRVTKIVTAEYTRIYYNKKKVDEYSNNGLLPVAYIKNLELPNSFDGLSDIQPIYEINDEINYSTSDRASALYYHGNPILAIINAGVKELEVSADRTLILPDEKADAKYIKRDTDFEAVNNHIADLKDTLLLIARLPKDFVEQSGVSNVSGVALLMLQAPLVKLVADKQVFYGEGLESANEIILKMMIANNALSGVSTFQTEIIFPPYLPADDRMQAETDQIKVGTIVSMVNAGMMSKETGMQALMDAGLLNISSVEDELKAIGEAKTKEGNEIFGKDYQNKGGDNNGQGDDEDQDENAGNKRK